MSQSKDLLGPEAEGTEAEIARESGRRTRRSFLAGGVASAAGYGLWRAIGSGPEIGRQSRTMRDTFQTNAAISRAVFAERGLSPTYPLSAATELRLNGSIGMAETLNLVSWRLQLAGAAVPQTHPRFVRDVTAWNYAYQGDMPADTQATDVKSAPGNGKSADPAPKVPTPAAIKTAPSDINPTGAVDSDAGAALAARIEALTRPKTGKRYKGDDEAGPSYSSLDIGTPGLLLTMADLQKLPFTEHVTQFRCIEGWSQIVHWGGYRLRDFIEAYPPQQINGRDPKFVYMETPDGNYYGGYDLSAARHPQSLLVTHMHGQPLTQQHGAPLRLFMPIKYGYKNVKRIGLISYTNTRPDDYWTKLGYDWYAGL